LGGHVIHTAHEFGVPVVLTLTEYFFLCPRLNLMHADSRLCVGPESDEKCARCLLEEKRRYGLLRQHAPALLDAYWSIASPQKNAALASQLARVTARRENLRAALAAVDRVICPSRFIMEKHAEFGVDTRNFVMIRHGLDKPDEAAPQPAPPGKPCLRIGYTGQIKVHKGIDLLVNAVRALLDAGQPVELQIWGKPDDQAAYARNLVNQTRAYPSIQWRGAFDGSRVWDVLAGMDVLVVPSRWYENCPTVILEAFKMGLPVVATALGGMAELVQPGVNGLHFRLNDASDLRAQLERLLTEPDLLEWLRAGIPDVKSAGEEVSQIYREYRLLLGEP
jgi:glycosyltransferase involved in cell wall biosynthesis